MKSASFFFVSMALHVAALAYPALFLELRAVRPVMVTILDVSGDGDGSNGDRTAPERKPALAARKSPPIKGQWPPVVEAEPVADLPKAISTPVIGSELSSATAISAGPTEESGSVESYSQSSGIAPSGVGGTDAGGMGDSRGSGSGRYGSGTGAGDGHEGDSASTFVQPRYNYCPKPDYPQRASREGWQGTVVLRVLVDQAGRPKSIEVYRSSGFAILDQAAVDNVKRRCRFHPARDGEKRVEHWTRVPVEFGVRILKN